MCKSATNHCTVGAIHGGSITVVVVGMRMGLGTLKSKQAHWMRLDRKTNEKVFGEGRIEWWAHGEAKKGILSGEEGKVRERI